VVFVGISVQDKDSDARSFLKEFKITYPNGPDSTNRISVNYGLTGVPEATFVNRDGLAVHNHIGPMTPSDLRTYLDEILR
jgi:cytochrome c biogenesis protein CcmG/thiol:disulfide interchange protein DsbE